MTPETVHFAVPLSPATLSLLEGQAAQFGLEPEEFAARVLNHLTMRSPREVEKLTGIRALPEGEPRKFLLRKQFGQAIGSVAGASKSVVGAASRSGHFLADKAKDAGESVGGVLRATKEAASDVRGGVVEHAIPLLVGLTDRVGEKVDALAENQTLRGLAQKFNLEQWLDVTERVDIEKAQAVVANLKKQHPEASPRQIAQRVMLQKALYAGGVGLSTSLLPGTAGALLAVDIASTALLQAELVFQIAAAYDLELDDPARKGELLAIFGCVLGANRAVKAGLSVLRNAPVAGAVIGASSNAAMLYALGYAACRFYEERLHLQSSQASINAVKQQNALFLEAASTQEKMADQILVHIILAGHPNANRGELLEQLSSLNLSPASLDAISSNIEHLKPLDELLSHIDADFAVYLLGRCNAIAQSDGIVTNEEVAVLETIARRFALALPT